MTYFSALNSLPISYQELRIASLKIDLKGEDFAIEDIVESFVLEAKGEREGRAGGRLQIISFPITPGGRKAFADFSVRKQLLEIYGRFPGRNGSLDKANLKEIMMAAATIEKAFINYLDELGIDYEYLPDTLYH